jgi:predicted amidohydrolase YtcJ
MLAISPKGSKIVDLKKRAVIPGIVDGHVHAELTAANQKLGLIIQCPEVGTVEEVLNLISEYAKKIPKGEWLIIRGPNAMANKLAEKRLPTIEEMDKAAPEHPAALFSAVHICVFNHNAIEKTGWWHETRLPMTSTMGRDQTTGEPNGVYTEIWGEKSFLIPWGYDKLVEAMHEGVLEYYASGGITTIHELPYSSGGIRGWQKMKYENRLPVRVRLYLTHPNLIDIDEFLKLGFGKDFGDEWISIGGIKLFVDGVMSHANGFMMDDLKWSQGELNDLVAKANDAGFQLWLHTLSPAAIKCAVEAFEYALGITPRVDHRHRIEHCADRWNRILDGKPFVSRELKEKIKRLGLIPVSTPQHISAFPDRPGVPTRTLINEGYITPGASDTTGAQPESCNPWYGIGCLVSRKNLYGKVLTPEECITPIEAIRMNTLWGAYCGFEEKIKGSLEPGKLADFCILDQDPLTIDSDAIKDITVSTTIVGGEITYSSGSFTGM